MSKPRKMTDVERTRTMLDLVHRSVAITTNGGAPSHVVVEEVAPGVGWAQRWADVLVLSMWPSKGLALEGYEVKASRADLKRELADPAKHRATARYCDRWWLLVWDESLLVDVGEIPATWGILVTVPGEDGERDLHVHRRAPKLTPDPWPRAFTCSLVRNAHQQSPGEGYLARACVAAARRGRVDGRSEVEGELRNLLEPLREIVYADKDRWMRPSDATSIIKTACEQLKQGSLFRSGAA